MVWHLLGPSDTSHNCRNWFQPRCRHFHHQTMRSGFADSVSVDFSCRTIKNISPAAVEMLWRKFFSITSAKHRCEACGFVPVERSFKRRAVVRLSDDQRTHLMYCFQLSKVRSGG